MKLKITTVLPLFADDDGSDTREGPVDEAGPPSSITERHGSESTTPGGKMRKTLFSGFHHLLKLSVNYTYHVS